MLVSITQHTKDILIALLTERVARNTAFMEANKHKTDFRRLKDQYEKYNNSLREAQLQLLSNARVKGRTL